MKIYYQYWKKIILGIATKSKLINITLSLRAFVAEKMIISIYRDISLKKVKVKKIINWINSEEKK